MKERWDVTLIDSFSPSYGDLFDVVTGSEVLGAFDSYNLPVLDPGLAWAGDYQADSMTLQVALAGDFDLDGDVDGGDFLAWQRGDETMLLTGNTLSDWETYFGATPPLHLLLYRNRATAWLLLGALGWLPAGGIGGNEIESRLETIPLSLLIALLLVGIKPTAASGEETAPPETTPKTIVVYGGSGASYMQQFEQEAGVVLMELTDDDILNERYDAAAGDVLVMLGGGGRGGGQVFSAAPAPDAAEAEGDASAKGREKRSQEWGRRPAMPAVPPRLWDAAVDAASAIRKPPRRPKNFCSPCSNGSRR